MSSLDPSCELVTKYKAALSSAKMGLWEYNFETQSYTWDEGIRLLYNIPSGIHGGRFDDWYLSLHPDDQQRILKEMEDSRQDLSELDTLFRFCPSPHETKYIRSNAIKIRNVKNEVIGLVGLNWDVTREYLLQDEFNKSKVFLEKVVNAIPDPVFIKSNDRKYVFVNHAFETLMETGKKQIIGKTDYDFATQEIADSCYELDVEVINSNGSVEREETFQLRPRNEPRQILNKKTVFNVNDEEKYIVGVIRDITEVKKIQNSLIEQSKMASLGEMAAEIAHEINNPLMIIQAKSQIMQEKLFENSGAIDRTKLAADLHAIENNSVRIDKIIKSLKSVSRKSNSDPFEQVSIRRILEEAVELSQERFRKNSIEINFHYDEQISYEHYVRARGSEIVQVLVNLLNNSFDAIKEMAKPWINVNLTSLENQYKIEVVDSGTPIPSDVVAKMMEPFFTTKTTGSGTGLGLSVSRQIIKNHSGDFMYDAKAPQTTFVFFLKKADHSQAIADADSAV